MVTPTINTPRHSVNFAVHTVDACGIVKGVEIASIKQICCIHSQKIIPAKHTAT